MTHDDSEPTDRIVNAVVDACSVAVGLGVMAVNRFQAVRRQVVEPSRRAGDGETARSREGSDGDGPTS